MGEPVVFVEAMAVVPNVIVFPHFDRMAGFLDQDRFQSLLHSVSELYTVVGIDEDTALVRIQPNVTSGVAARWRVMGRQTVNVFSGDGKKQVLRNGDELTL